MSEKSPFKFSNGETVKCKLTGFTGVITGRVEYLTGCIRYIVQPTALKDDGGMAEDRYIDECQLEGTDAAPVVLRDGASPAGPRDRSSGRAGLRR